MLDLSAKFWVVLQQISNAGTYARRSPWVTAANQPDEIKTYPGKEHLFASRIFKPANSSSDSKLPLIIRIHGGGFIMNNPAADDQIARLLADRVECLVASVDYSKAPRRPFPAAYEDLVDLSLTIIADTHLGVDPHKVMLCGSSSGANLALAVAQDVRLQSKLLGVVALTPATDLVTPLKKKLESRPDPSVPDFLGSMYESIVKMYVGQANVSLEDVRLSPTRFASPADLPTFLYFTGAEHDLLCREAREMAERVAEGHTKTTIENGWHTDNVVWRFIPGQKHGFENFAIKDKELDRQRLQAVDAMLDDLVKWVRQVFRGP